MTKREVTGGKTTRSQRGRHERKHPEKTLLPVGSEGKKCQDSKGDTGKEIKEAPLSSAGGVFNMPSLLYHYFC